MAVATPTSTATAAAAVAAAATWARQHGSHHFIENFT